MNIGVLAGKKALVCGASEGIGLACAQALAELGAEITLLARREGGLQSALQTLDISAQQQHRILVADVLVLEPVLAQIQTAGFDILINNSAGPSGGALHSATEQQLLQVFQQHLIGNQKLLQAVLPHMKAKRWGRIVNIISTSVKEPIAMLGVSNTIRGAVASWAKTLASELGGDGITVNNVLPGYTRTQRLQQILQERSLVSGKSEVKSPMPCLLAFRRHALPNRRKSRLRWLFCASHRPAMSTALICQLMADVQNPCKRHIKGWMRYPITGMGIRDDSH